MAFNLFCHLLVLTRHAHQPTNNNVRFKAQTYTDRGPTIKFKNEYNKPRKRELILLLLLKLISIASCFHNLSILKLLFYKS